MIYLFTIEQGNGGFWVSEIDITALKGPQWFASEADAKDWLDNSFGGAEINWTKYNDGTQVGAVEGGV